MLTVYLIYTGDEGGDHIWGGFSTPALAEAACKEANYGVHSADWRSRMNIMSLEIQTETPP